MSKGWDEMRRAKEESYFEKKNRESIEKLRQKRGEEKPRLSPITGQPMVQEDLSGVVIDRCPDSGGIWLDAGELEQLIDAATSEGDGNNAVLDFFKSLTGKK